MAVPPYLSHSSLASALPVSNVSACPDPDMDTLCPDGRTCAKNHGQCVSKGITWEGCEGGQSG
eukprot:3293986-Rhodomonas_salina.1